ncbi:MAG: cyclic pyranopterin monophosphate synthase MoaC [Chloroflexi bacterium]|nr:cyclic pyranopterin monophosphate synthase MoaC [Chloroflexota bacterium]MCH2523591.1 cyclic pyranopterin monophosphate synthase MoaC [Dehalococcoidia bacterium]|tara:strand:- start:913 stop:1377 length:465 start_codon:yes stop_codon:yes gene_type:complete
MFSHIDDQGNAQMVDISDKDITVRIATAEAKIEMASTTLEEIINGAIPKGNVLNTAKIAGIISAKKTHELIPLCHQILLSGIDIGFYPDQKNAVLVINSTVKTTYSTGVEMEALTAVSVAALTIYDMCKAVDKNMKITNIHLVSKTGGQSSNTE